MKRLIIVFGFITSIAAPVLAAEPTFTKEEVQAAYALGQADAARAALVATPAARSMAEKMKAQTPQAQTSPTR